MEGEKGGILAEVDYFLREKQWPVVEDEPNEGGGTGVGGNALEATPCNSPRANCSKPSSGQRRQSVEGGNFWGLRRRRSTPKQRQVWSHPYKRDVIEIHNSDHTKASNT